MPVVGHRRRLPLIQLLGLLGLIVLVILDLAFSAIQHYQVPLDGDISAIVVPAARYQHVLTDPLGLAAWRGEVYAAPNRFFSHYAMVAWCRAVPGALQNLDLKPIASVYGASALFKTGVQLALLVLLAGYAGGTLNIRRRTFWLAAVLLAPLFQTVGYQVQMGIIDRALTYNFFYALPLTMLLLLLWPFYAAARRGQPLRLSWGTTGLLLALALVVALSGAVATGVVSVLLPGLALWWAARHWRGAADGVTTRARQALAPLTSLPLRPVLVLVGLGALSLYSLWIGRQNSENASVAHVSLVARYGRLAQGLGYVLTGKLGLPLLILGAGCNLLLLRRWAGELSAAGGTTSAAFWTRAATALGVFTLAYLLLLPLGGYREYREYVVRYDTFLPITLGLCILFAGTAVELLRQLPTKRRQTYAAGLTTLVLLFVIADHRLTLRPAESNLAERAAMAQLAVASPTNKPVALPPGTRLMTWDDGADPAIAALNAELLYRWHVTARPVPYVPTAAANPRNLR